MTKVIFIPGKLVKLSNKPKPQAMVVGEAALLRNDG